jgi:hypothetical protein
MQYGYQQPNQQYNAPPPLPYVANQLVVPFLQIGIGNPTHIPNIPVPPQIAPAMPLLVSAAEIEIQSKAYQQGTPLRVFFHNEHARNNFMNPEFDSLIMAIVPMLVDLLTAVNLEKYPGLVSYMDGNSMQAAQSAIQTFKQIAGDIANWRAGGRMQAPPQAQYNTNTYPQAGQTYGGHATRFGGGQALGGGSALFGGQRAAGAPTAGAAGSTQNDSRYDAQANNYAGAGEVVKQPFQASATHPANQQTETVVAAEPREVPGSQMAWKPSAKYPYYFAHNPLKHELFYRINVDGTIDTVLKEKELNVLDYERHKTSTVFGTVPRTLDLMTNRAKVLAQIENGIKQINTVEPITEMPDDVPDGEQKPVTSFIKKEWIAENSLTAAWFFLGTERLLHPDDKGSPDVYRIYAQISKPILSDKDETQVVQDLAKCNNFLELRDKLVILAPTISAELWGLANLKMTDTVNRIIKQNLSIPKLKITDFVADIEDLQGILERKYGASIHQGFMKFQKAHIATAFMTLDNGVADKVRDDMFDGMQFPEGKRPALTFLTSNMSLTYVNFRSHELEVELATDTSAALSRAVTPVLYQLVEGLYQQADKAGQFDRHLIKTADGRILEASKGYIVAANGGEFYLLTLVE